MKSGILATSDQWADNVQSRGFTLIELLVVIAIIGLLASIITATLIDTRVKAKYAAAKQLDANFYHNLGDSLVGEWLFEECSGTTAMDSSGLGRNGTIAGGVTWSANTPFSNGCAASFDGATGKLTGGAITVGKAMSISAWILKNAATGQKSFFSNRGGGVVYLGLSGTQVFLYDNGGMPPSIYSGNNAITLGQWQFIVATSDGSALRFYVNGSLISNVSQTRNASSGTYGIGWDPSIGTEFWDGSIDNVRIYDRALETAEIRRLYAEGAATHHVAVAEIGASAR